MADAKVSVIVPVYNVEKYLPRCLDSIIGQTYRNLEIILVDDGSLDESGAICNAFALSDDRIRVYSQKNQGVSAARNTGILKATGEYIVFLDSDDQVSHVYIENLMKEPGADYVASGCYVQQKDDSWLCWSNNTFYSLIEDIRKNPELLDNIPIGMVWAKRFDRRVVLENKLTFDTKITRGEDTLFNVQYLMVCKSVSVLDSNDYYYYRNDSSATAKFNPRLFSWTTKMLDLLKDFAGENSALFKRWTWNNLKNVIENYQATSQGGTLKNKTRLIGPLFEICVHPYTRNALSYGKQTGDVVLATLIKWYLYPLVPVFYGGYVKIKRKIAKCMEK